MDKGMEERSRERGFGTCVGVTIRLGLLSPNIQLCPVKRQGRVFSDLMGLLPDKTGKYSTCLEVSIRKKPSVGKDPQRVPEFEECQLLWGYSVFLSEA